MSATVANPVAGLVAFLKADPIVGELTDGRVFGGELPEAQNMSMPRACVVLKPSGGGGQLGGGYQQFSDRRLDAYCYGPTPRNADELCTAVSVALKQLQRTIQAGTLIHWCRTASGAMSLRDSSTEWPYSLASFQVLASEVAIA
jgi:hypothetical protein